MNGILTKSNILFTHKYDLFDARDRRLVTTWVFIQLGRGIGKHVGVHKPIPHNMQQIRKNSRKNASAYRSKTYPCHSPAVTSQEHAYVQRTRSFTSALFSVLCIIRHRWPTGWLYDVTQQRVPASPSQREYMQVTIFCKCPLIIHKATGATFGLPLFYSGHNVLRKYKQELVSVLYNESYSSRETIIFICIDPPPSRRPHPVTGFNGE